MARSSTLSATLLLVALAAGLFVACQASKAHVATWEADEGDTGLVDARADDAVFEDEEEDNHRTLIAPEGKGGMHPAGVGMHPAGVGMHPKGMGMHKGNRCEKDAAGMFACPAKYAASSVRKCCLGLSARAEKNNLHYCVNIRKNAGIHCGACGKVCKKGRVCCGGNCVNLRRNKYNCGSCYNDCVASVSVNSTCVGGVCTKSPTDSGPKVGY